MSQTFNIQGVNAIALIKAKAGLVKRTVRSMTAGGLYSITVVIITALMTALVSEHDFSVCCTEHSIWRQEVGLTGHDSPSQLAQLNP